MGLIAVAQMAWNNSRGATSLGPQNSPFQKGELMVRNDFSSIQLTLSTNIKALRQERGLAQERLGLESGVDRTMVSKIERRIANPTLEILVKLANCLDVEVGELLEHKDRQ